MYWSTPPGEWFFIILPHLWSDHVLKGVLFCFLICQPHGSHCQVTIIHKKGIHLSCSSLLSDHTSRKQDSKRSADSSSYFIADRPVAHQIKYRDIARSQPPYFMVSRFHLICSVHKLTGGNLKFNMEKGYNEGPRVLCDEIMDNPSYGHGQEHCRFICVSIYQSMFVCGLSWTFNCLRTVQMQPATSCNSSVFFPPLSFVTLHFMMTQHSLSVSYQGFVLFIDKETIKTFYDSYTCCYDTNI